MNITELLAKVNLLRVDEIVSSALRDTRPFLLELIRTQIEHGRSSEDYIGVYKSPRYANKKQSMGSKAPHGIVDLKYSGAFLKSLYARIGKKSITVRAKDNKASKITAIYGDAIYTLTDENMSKYIEHLLPIIQNRIKNGLLQ